MSDDWTPRRIGDLGKVITGKTPSTKMPEYFGGEYPFITIPDLNGRRDIFDSVRTLSQSGADCLRSCKLPPGAVMMSCIATIGKCGITTMPSFTNQQINSVICNSSVDPKFLYYVFTRLGSSLEAVGGGGSVYTNISKSRFEDIEIMIPSLNQQIAIACILGALDDKIELNRRMNKTLEEMARAIFKSWFVDFDPIRAKAAVRKQHPKWTNDQVSHAACPNLKPEIATLFPDSFQESEFGEIPKGWCIGRLGDIIQLFDSKRIPLSSRERRQRQGHYRYYGAAGILDYIDDFVFDGIFILVGEDGSVVTKSGNPVVQYVWGRFWVNNHAHVIKALGDITDEYLLLLLQQLNVVPFVTGAVQPKLSQTNLNTIPIVRVLPKVSIAFGRLIEPIFSKMRASNDEIDFLATIRDILLPKLLSGSLKITEAERIAGRYV